MFFYEEMQTYRHQHNSSLYSEYFSLDLSLELKCAGIVSPSLCTCDGAATCPPFHLLDSTALITEKDTTVTVRANK